MCFFAFFLFKVSSCIIGEFGMALGPVLQYLFFKQQIPQDASLWVGIRHYLSFVFNF